MSRFRSSLTSKDCSKRRITDIYLAMMIGSKVIWLPSLSLKLVLSSLSTISTFRELTIY